tara:strand:+ start:386 stop:868 length:483 start_codon:yes stop_codon:yes gene_type:complete
MIEPISAVAMATTAFTTVKRFISAGQEFEQCVGQMGKWFTAVSDFRKGQSLQRRPPIFKKLFSAGSVEEEALALLIHEKKISEQEKELMVLLNFRFGPGTWDELKEMRRKIAKQREDEIWRQAELRRNLIEGVSVTVLLFMIIGFVGLLVYLYMKSRGMV